MSRRPRHRTVGYWTALRRRQERQRSRNSGSSSPATTSATQLETQPPLSPPYVPGPMPDDEEYRGVSALRQRTYDTSIGGIRDAENQSALNYGLSFSRNDQDEIDPRSVRMPSFTASSEGFDPANPFSRASLLSRAYFTGNNVATGSYANRGQLNSGAYQRSLNRNTLSYQQGTNDLLQDFTNRLLEYRQQRGDAASQRDIDLINDRRDLMARIAAQREY